MPSSRATARSDSADAPVSASWRRAASLIAAINSARARARADWTAGALGAGTTPVSARSLLTVKNSALDNAPLLARCSKPRAVISHLEGGSPMRHYQQPGWFTTHVFNRLVRAATRL